MNYDQCLRYLKKVQNLGVKFGLENVRTILASLDNPHEKYPSILVGGSNGKGSVCAYLVRILTLHGYSTGLFTSPHLIRVEERIRIGDELISKRLFSQNLSILSEIIENLLVSQEILSHPTYFELMSCLAFLYFKEQKVDIAVLEVGMGGRFDATNVVKPVVSVITTISPEHQKILGETLKQIAFEKAGIIKPDVPVVCGVEDKEARDTIEKKARDTKAPFIDVFRQARYIMKHKRESHSLFEYETARYKYVYSPSLNGEHQGKNAATAIAASEQLSQEWKKLANDKIVQGIETTRWEGRLEMISQKPLILLDGAHNEEGALALRKYIEDFVPYPLILVFATMRDKKIEQVAEILFPLARKIIFTQFPFFKAASPEEIKNRTSKFKERIVLEPDMRKAVNLALQSVEAKEAILITGSLFLVGEVKKIWESKNI